MPIRSLLTTLLVGCVLAGCGQSDGLDTTDPKAVAVAYTIAGWHCGEDGAGLRYDLSTTTSPHGRWTRERYLSEERRHGCRPQTPPVLRPALVAPPTADLATVALVASPDPPSRTVSGVRGTAQLVRVDGAWKVDTYRSTIPQPDLPSSPS